MYVSSKFGSRCSVLDYSTLQLDFSLSLCNLISAAAKPRHPFLDFIKSTRMHTYSSAQVHVVICNIHIGAAHIHDTLFRRSNAVISSIRPYDCAEGPCKTYLITVLLTISQRYQGSESSIGLSSQLPALSLYYSSCSTAGRIDSAPLPADSSNECTCTCNFPRARLGNGED